VGFWICFIDGWLSNVFLMIVVALFGGGFEGLFCVWVFCVKAVEFLLLSWFGVCYICLRVGGGFDGFLGAWLMWLLCLVGCCARVFLGDLMRFFVVDYGWCFW